LRGFTQIVTEGTHYIEGREFQGEVSCDGIEVSVYQEIETKKVTFPEEILYPLSFSVYLDKGSGGQ
jgi:hypothetical protein